MLTPNRSSRLAILAMSSRHASLLLAISCNTNRHESGHGCMRGVWTRHSLFLQFYLRSIIMLNYECPKYTVYTRFNVLYKVCQSTWLICHSATSGGDVFRVLTTRHSYAAVTEAPSSLFWKTCTTQVHLL